MELKRIGQSTITVISDFDVEELKAVGPVILQDENGNSIYAVSYGTAAFTEKQFSACDSTDEGKACIVCIDITKKEFVKEKLNAFGAYKAFAKEIQKVINAKIKAVKELEDALEGGKK